MKRCVRNIVQAAMTDIRDVAAWKVRRVLWPYFSAKVGFE
jgi:hypothetical protein